MKLGCYVKHKVGQEQHFPKPGKNIRDDQNSMLCIEKLSEIPLSVCFSLLKHYIGHSAVPLTRAAKYCPIVNVCKSNYL